MADELSPFEKFLTDSDWSFVDPQGGVDTRLEEARKKQWELVSTTLNKLFPNEARITLRRKSLVQLPKNSKYQGQVARVMMFVPDGKELRPVLQDMGDIVGPWYVYEGNVEDLRALSHLNDMEYGYKYYPTGVRLKKPSVKIAMTSPVRTAGGQDGLVVGIDPHVDDCTVLLDDEEKVVCPQASVIAYGPPVLAEVEEDPVRSLALYESPYDGENRLVYIHAISLDGRVKVSDVRPTETGEPLVWICALDDLDLSIPESSHWSYALAQAGFITGDEILYVDPNTNTKYQASIEDYSAEEGLSLVLEDGSPVKIESAYLDYYQERGLLKQPETKLGEWFIGRDEAGFYRSARLEPHGVYASATFDSGERLVSGVPLARLFRSKITQRSDGWHVMSEEGKNLGGPYGTKAEAEKRLRQVEYFKHQSEVLYSTGIPPGTVFQLWSANAQLVFAQVIRGLPAHTSQFDDPVFMQVAPELVQEFTSALETLRTGYGVPYEHTGTRPDIKCLPARVLGPILHAGNDVISISNYPEKTAGAKQAYHRLNDTPELAASAWVDVDLADGRRTVVRRTLKHLFEEG